MVPASPLPFLSSLSALAKKDANTLRPVLPLGLGHKRRPTWRSIVVFRTSNRSTRLHTHFLELRVNRSRSYRNEETGTIAATLALDFAEPPTIQVRRQ